MAQEKNELTGEPRKKPQLKESLFLAEQATQGGLKVVPGKTWALHYPKNGAQRQATLQGLLNGSVSSVSIDAESLKPNGLIYKAQDIADHGLEAVQGRITDITSRTAYYDYQGLVNFCDGLKGRQVNAELAQQLYDGVTQSRLRQRIYNAYGSSGRAAMKQSFQQEAKQSAATIQQTYGTPRVLEALKFNWLTEEMKVLKKKESDTCLSQLTTAERTLYDSLKDSFREYTRNGDSGAFDRLVSDIREQLPLIQKLPEEPAKPEPSEKEEKPPEDWSEEEQELQEELKDLMKQMGEPGGPSTPGNPHDPAIPPDDQDEYHTPPPQEGGQMEKGHPEAFFTITSLGKHPPIVGDYCSGRKSYYDRPNKTWSKKKQLTPYHSSIGAAKRYLIEGNIEAGLKSLPLPNHYAVDASTLKVTGGTANIFRDQNGCFYIQSQGGQRCQFSIEFAEETPAYISQPKSEDGQRLSPGTLSSETETFLQGLSGTKRDMARNCRDFIRSRKWYPGGGNLEEAGALQHKLRSESTGDNYLHNLDASPYLECYSANTLFIDMARRKGIPARLVVGHKADSARGGKVQLNNQTGHAWSEIWDDQVNEWIRFDATPPPKAEDKKKKDQDEEEKQSEEQEPSTPTESAEDGGENVPPDQDQGEAGDSETSEASSEAFEDLKEKMEERQKQVQEELEQKPGEKLEEANNEEFADGEKALEELQKEKKQMDAKKQEFQEQMKDAKSSSDLADIQDQLGKEEMLEGMKDDLQKELDARIEENKDKLKEKIEDMSDDGFIDEQRRDELAKAIQEGNIRDLQKIEEQLKKENALYNEYEIIREEIEPLVDEWAKYFAERLPKQDEIDIDEDALHRQGRLSRKAMQRPINRLLGTVKNPRIFRPETKPRFIAVINVDTSGSMQGEKLHIARKMLVFYSELFSRISKEFGYIHFAINVFSDGVKSIKEFDQNYDSAERYHFEAQTDQTVKMRLMTAVQTQGGTNMLAAVERTAQQLNEMTLQYPDHLTSMYWLGDGGDTCGNKILITEYLQKTDSTTGFGEHFRSACVMGGPNEKRELEEVFGEGKVNVTNSLETMIEQSMEQFDTEVTDYVKTLKQ